MSNDGYQDYLAARRADLMTAEQLAQRLHVTADTVRGWKDRYRIAPQRMVGGLMRYRWSEVSDVIRRCPMFREQEGLSMDQVADVPVQLNAEYQHSSRHPFAILGHTKRMMAKYR